MNNWPALASHPVLCPYCSAPDTTLLSLFGQQLLTVQYYCHACHTPFEYVKDDVPLETPAVSEPMEERKETT